MSNKPDYSVDFAAAHDMTAFIEKLTGMVSETADLSDLSIMQPKGYEITNDDGYRKFYSFEFDRFAIHVEIVAGAFDSVLVLFDSGYTIVNTDSDSLLHRYARDLVAAYFGDLL